MKHLISIMIVCMMFLYSCSEENNRVPVVSDSVISGQVSKVTVERLPGAVKLTYDLPDDESLLYVKAECMINGVLRQAKATSYVNHLTLDGFADTSVYTINLYSVNYSEKASEPVQVTARPLTPYYLRVFETMQMVDDWGGATLFFENPSETDLAITMTYVDDTGFWSHGETFYTKQREGSCSLRGMQPVKTKFGVYIRDRWNNTTDTLFVDLLPRFEKELDPIKFRELRLPGDPPMSNVWHVSLASLWDRNFGKLESNIGALFLTVPNATWPHWCTFDMGVEQGAQLSRVRLWQRTGVDISFGWQDRNIKKFEIWGSMNPNLNGSWDESWIYLMEGEFIKPSGLPLGQHSDEDLQSLLDGHEFTFPLNVPLVRFIRIKCTQTWSGALAFCLMQTVFWGNEPSDLPEE